MDDHSLDIRVAVDFGTTYTGVTWDTPKEMVNGTNIVNQWPGASGFENKVPTALAKKSRDWGFLCDDMAEDEKWKLFKPLLDPEHHQLQAERNGDKPWIPEKLSEVHQHVIRYLNHIYNHISEVIPLSIRNDLTLSEELRKKSEIWASMKVEFIFSTPTTWSPPITQRFRGLVFEAGFGEGKNHNVVLGLTEAEAAAVFAHRRLMNDRILNGNVLFMIDAGGGTTDLAFVTKAKDSLALTEIRPVIGHGVGSIQIDKKFTKLVEDRINENRNFRDQLPANFALKASQSRGFQDWKKSYGVEDWDQTPDDKYWSIKVDNTGELNHCGMKISKGKMVFERTKLEACFQETWREMKDHIQRALDGASDPAKGDSIKVDYIVLSGGLGSSNYIFMELEKHINFLRDRGNRCVSGATVLQAQADAQMVVILGLLEDRKNETRALREYIARANYGITNSPSSRVSIISATGSEERRIDWRVKYRDRIEVGKPISIEIIRELGKNDERRWTEEIVWAIATKDSLPEDMKQG
ncbi:hypothetical protein FPRO04_08723 [Fusarium proliferatum]|nr:hypothetical protein FPRO03_02000 [Fusarium proliferatum]KAG4275061.1 hypothetical protein FPRO04_08723 [Fusarium proliferatum]